MVDFNMTTNEYLYNDKYAKTKIFRVNNPGEDYKTWKLEP